MKSESTLKNQTQLKRCPKCERELPLESFHKDKYGKFGRSWQCKECRNVKPEDRKTEWRTVTDKPRKCTLCGDEYLPTSNRQLYCVKCQREVNIKHCREYYKRTFIPKGRAHLIGENANGYIDGIGIYSRYKEEIGACERCGSEKFLCVHHKDRDRHNNDRENLEVLCKSCHQKEHLIRDSLGRFQSSK